MDYASNLYRAAIGGLVAASTLIGAATMPAQAGGLENKIANPSLTFENIRVQREENKTIYHYDRVLRESNGVEVRLTDGRLCYEKDDRCITGKVDFTVPPKGELRLKNKEFWTTYEQEKLVLEYWGTDANGNNIGVKAVMEHPQKLF